METDQYLVVFLDESREHLQALSDNILKLEKNPEALEIINEVFRSAHTLKGMAASMGFEDIASLTHQMENTFDKIRNNKLTVTAEVIDIVLVAIEHLEEMVEAIAVGNDDKRDVSALLERLTQLEKKSSDENTSNNKEETKSLATSENLENELDQYQLNILAQAKDTGFSGFKITVRLNKNCLLKGARAYMVFEILEDSGEIIKTMPSIEDMEEGNFEDIFSFFLLSKDGPEELKKAIENISEIDEVNVENLLIESSHDNDQKSSEENTDVQTKESSKNNGNNHFRKTIRVNLERIDELLNLFEELVIERGRMEAISEDLKNRDLDETVEHVNRISSQMQNLLLSLRMVPIDQVFNRFPRMIRELSRDLNKKVDLEIFGADTELDRTVIDEISDPLVHMIRNSLDHGIEMPDVRIKSGKPEEGKLILRAFHSGNHVFIEIEDDGSGIDRKKVEKKAIEKGLLSADHAKTLSDDEVYQFILRSGFSTANEVSDISGRGVGLDVVKNKIESLGGHLYITSKIGKGTKFSVQLPLTLSIIATLLVKVQNQIFAIPLSSIIQTNMLSEEDFMYVGGQRVVDFRGQVIPLVSLTKMLLSKDEAEDKTEYAVVIVKKGDRMAGLIVDSFIGQKEIVIKSLGNYLGDVFGFSGATILGDGQIALILDPNAFIK